MHTHIQERINKIQHGEVPEGYRKTKVGIIPNSWSVKKLQDIAPLQRGFDLPKQQLTPGHYPVAYSNGILNHHIEFKVPGPGVFTGRSGTIGKVFYVNDDYWPHNTTLWVTDFKGNNPKFIYYFYQSVNLLRFNAGTSVPTLNRNDVHIAKASLPPLPEQQKIAEILSAWDDAIRLQHELIEQKQTQKRGLMQLLLSGKIRVTEMGKLSPEAVKKRVTDIQQGIVPEGYRKTKLGIIPDSWSVKKLQDIAPLQRGFDLPKQQLTPGHYPVAYSNGILNNHIEFKVPGPGVFTGRSGTIGKVFYVNDDYWPHNTTLWVTDFKGNNPKFIYYFYQSINLLRFNAGTSVPTLNRNDVHIAKAFLPPLPEQQKIADILTSADKEIELLETELAQMQEQKKGLMQLLLSGKIRVHEFQEGETNEIA